MITIQERNTRLLLLGWTAGCIDAISYLGLGHVFTANMTGNTVLLGLAIGQGQFGDVLRAGIALVGFGFGVALGATMVSSPRQTEDDWPRSVTTVLDLELLLLVGFGIGWWQASKDLSNTGLDVLIGLSALTMGLQSAAVQQLRVAGVATTYITGTITTLITETLKGRYSRPAKTDSSSRQFKAALLGIYLLAAIISGFVQSLWQNLAVLLPVIAVAIVVGRANFKK